MSINSFNRISEASRDIQHNLAVANAFKQLDRLAMAEIVTDEPVDRQYFVSFENVTAIARLTILDNPFYENAQRAPGTVRAANYCEAQRFPTDALLKGNRMEGVLMVVL